MDRIAGERKKWPIDAILERVSLSYSFGEIKLPSKSRVSFSELYTSDKSLIEVAESLRLREFVRLMKSSGLSSELNSIARYTVFVPSDQAFSALPPGTLEELAGDKELLRDTLMLHIAEGKIVAEAMKDNFKITSLDSSGELWVNVVDEGEVLSSIFTLNSVKTYLYRWKR